MTKLEKYLTMSVAAVGALTGGMATYTDYTGAEFKKPIDLRQATVASFLAQIDSASKRRDHREALRVRLEYERFEESWRNSQRLSSLIAPIENLISLRVAPGQASQIRNILHNASTDLSSGFLTPGTLGSVYLATGDYQNASKYYKLAALSEPNDPNIHALRALALQGEAKGTEPETAREELNQEAKQLVQKAESGGVDADRIKALAAQLAKET